MKNQILRSFLLSTVLLVGTSMCASAQDIYIGTIEFKNGGVELKRCDIAQNRYTLVDSPGEKDGAVRRLKNAHGKAPPPLYGEVIGTYSGDNMENNRLVVHSIGNLTPGKSCHLLD